MDSSDEAWRLDPLARVLPAVRPRKLAKVPFVELAEGRLQGVVSSGSDIERVYVSSITAGSHGLSCSTNNNRPCGGLNGGSLCKHLQSLAEEAVQQYGLDRVARYLKVEVPEGSSLAAALSGSRDPAPAAAVFSRFLRHLAYLEAPASTAAEPEMQWFRGAGAVV
ncbi:hypothetical protein KDL01_12665 [Actinospica durhamensis]|uniref:Uncharacterized protein n=1 Tax=Actinospica durhamensis TaxID=1508375 RepID=A0A941EMP9_9ACTN|nr:hypothetical protein [Actinospica durhamensis]MBR7834121.1 hypothetical protein [Actinospica durhamensis]